jgi:hypothetical protein
VLHEKGGKERRIPCHHLARDYLRSYVAASALAAKDAPLFQGAPRHAGRLSGEAMSRPGVLAIVKRRCLDAGLPNFIHGCDDRARKRCAAPQPRCAERLGAVARRPADTRKWL